MKNTSTSTARWLPALLAGGCLALTLGYTSPSHATENKSTNTQVAWWYGGYGPHYYGYGGYRGGWNYNRGACERRCWRNSWGRLRCATRCF